MGLEYIRTRRGGPVKGMNVDYLGTLRQTGRGF